VLERSYVHFDLTSIIAYIECKITKVSLLAKSGVSKLLVA